MKLYLEINLGVSENSFCSVSDHFHDCNIIDSWNTPIQQSNPTSSIINSIVLYVSVTRWQTIKFRELIIFFFSTSRNTSCFSNISISLLICFLFFFFHQDYTYSSENEKLSSFRQLFFANKYCVKSDHSQSSIQ